MASTLTALRLHELRLRIANRIEQLPQERQKHLTKLSSRITGFLQSIMEIADSLPQDKTLETLNYDYVGTGPHGSLALHCRFADLTKVDFYIEGDDMKIRMPYSSGSLKKLSEYLSQKYNNVVYVPVAYAANGLETFSIDLDGKSLFLSFAIDEKMNYQLVTKIKERLEKDVNDLGLEIYFDGHIVDIKFS